MKIFVPLLLLQLLIMSKFVFTVLEEVDHYRYDNATQSIPVKRLNETYAEFRARILQNYNAENGPGENYFHKRTINLNISLHISSLSGVSVEKMEFIVGMYLAQQWRDPRLQFRGIEKVSFYGDMTDKIWTPDTYFPNDKDGYRHEITRRNTFIRIFPNGTVYYVQRLKITVSCQMHLQWFPVDIQKCDLILESYGHTAQEIYLRWYQRWEGDRGQAVTLEDGAMQSPEVSKPVIEIKEELVSYGGTTDKYSSIKVIFTLKRNIVFYIFDAYMPFMSIVTVAWSSCWISVQAVPARASIGVVTVLSIVVHNAGIQRQLPHVSYMKALDLYMIVSLCFVMLSLAEFCTAHMLVMHRTLKVKSDCSLTVDTTNTCNGGQCPGRKRKRCRRRTTLSAELLDRITRIAFPILFIAFNIVYWAWLLKRHSD